MEAERLRAIEEQEKKEREKKIQRLQGAKVRSIYNDDNISIIMIIIGDTPAN